MRTLGQLEKQQQSRLRDYIEKWPTMTTKQLSEDLYLRPTSVAAVRAHLTRTLNKRFNDMLGG